ncbi:MAG: glycosyltransferase [Chloroflexi bacterium]|uniref:glycosyltransferase family 2 protein n=1 Tax=Candidatus Flexifilum breve TaxID=3140694 RepID=UPI003135F823|nr:glycosyltransferase [Chloroflexota bacterium]
MSIIIPCHNTEPWIAECIESCFAQTYSALEIIVIDDGSTDGSLAIIEQYRARIRYETGSNKGSCAARNRGIELARGSYILFLDSDDVLLPTTIEVLFRALQHQENAIAVCPWYPYCWEAGEWVAHPPTFTLQQVSADEIRNELSGRFWMPPGAMLWPRAVVERNGAWDQTTAPNDDGDFRIRALLNNVRLLRISDGGLLYRIHSNSLSRARSEQAYAGRFRALEKIEHSLREQERLSAYVIDLSRAYHRLASGGFQQNPQIARRCLNRARVLGGWRSVNGSWFHVVLCLSIGLERKTTLATALAAHGVARRRRTAAQQPAE